MSNASPVISIVIPTRERCDTLAATLRTCTDQDYDNLEILVSDNASTDGTEDCVRSVQDRRVRYIRTPHRVSMSHNWEFALSQVRGEYVTYVGDDDALLPGAVAELADLVRQTGTAAISWAWASYFWPSTIHAPSRNLLLVPSKDSLEERSASQVLRRVLGFQTGYEHLPFFYKGLVSIKLVERVKQASGGTFFHSMVPDVYSAIALGLVADRYHYSFRPYSLNGTSAASNGAAHFLPSRNAAAAQIFLREDNIPFHRDLALAPSLAIATAESYLQARERLSQAMRYGVSIPRMLEAALTEAECAETARYEKVVHAAREIAAKHGLAGQLENLIRKFPNRPRNNIIGLEEGFNILSGVHIINCARFGVHNIHQAAYLCAAILGTEKLGLMRSPAAVARTTAALGKGLIARVFHELKMAALR